MKSIVDALPPEIAKLVHPAVRANEAAYWAQRDQLLAQYRDQWIAYANGRVLAAGTSPVEIFHAAHASGLHPFVVCVGREHEPCRMRRAAFAYDPTYPSESLPVLAVEFRQRAGSPGFLLDRVIPDTGADASALPWSECQQVGLDPTTAVPALMGGVGATALPTLVFSLWARIDGNDYPCRLQADFAGNERILGRDVLNRVEVLFRGPAGEVVINP